MPDSRADTIVRVIVAGNSTRPLQKIADTLVLSGLYIQAKVELAALTQAHTTKTDIIFVDLDEDSDQELDQLDYLVATSHCPVVFSDTSQWQDFERWGRRIASKLYQSVKEYQKQELQQVSQERPKTVAEAPYTGQKRRQSDHIELTIQPQPEVTAETIPSLNRFGELVHDPSQKVWVLGASLGGPEVVKHFLAALPGVPPVCMILGQHIGENFTEILASQLNRVTGMSVVPARNGDRVQNGVVYVAPIEERLKIDKDGVFSIVEETRPRLYKACIDYLMEEVALRYGKNANAIVFSGMGDDGTEGVKIIARVGGSVWAQSAETCIISSMPDCARATGYVSWSGSPEGLAIKLMQETAVEQEFSGLFQGSENLTRH